MATKNKSTEKFTQKRDIDLNLLSKCDTICHAEKIQNPHIPLGAGADGGEADVTLLSKGNNKDRKPHEVDCEAVKAGTLTAMELRLKYPREANCHRNMLQRRQTEGAVIHPHFRPFWSFLWHVGPQPIPTATIHRINPHDPEYAPGKAHWADKTVQSNNRCNSHLYDTPYGQCTTAELAKQRGVTPAAIRKQRSRGHSRERIVAGGRSAPAMTQAPTPSEKPENSIFLPKDPSLVPVWDRARAQAYPGEWHMLTPREQKQLREIAASCVQGTLLYYAEDLLEHVIKNWTQFGWYAKSHQGAFGIPDRPDVFFLAKYLRSAINLYLKDNDLEFKNNAVRPKEVPAPSAPESFERPATPTVTQPKFVDMPYEPRAFVCEPDEWTRTAQTEKDRLTALYGKRDLQPYNAKYTATTGKLPPPECCEPFNGDAICRYLHSWAFRKQFENWAEIWADEVDAERNDPALLEADTVNPAMPPEPKGESDAPAEITLRGFLADPLPESPSNLPRSLQLLKHGAKV